jgi:DNA-binding GntR family transcriptional regulator
VAILSGALEPGSPLRLERLARTLEMSPVPVREAIRRLEALVLAEHVPHRGARVSRLSIEDLRDDLSTAAGGGSFAAAPGTRIGLTSRGAGTPRP